MIDLIWTDVQAALTLSLLDPLVLWEDSLSSDHALLRLCWHIDSTLIDHTIAHSLALNTKHLDQPAHDAWIAAVKAALPPLAPLRTLDATKTFFLDLTMAITIANEAHFPHRKPPHARSQPWWNTDCTHATHQLQQAGLAAHVDRQHAQQHLRRVVREAKHSWATKTIHESSIWDITQWRHGRHLSHISALRLPDSTLTYDHEPMAMALSACFFIPPVPGLLTQQPDDPPPLPERDLDPFLAPELAEYLWATSSNSTPGPSQISWPILKWLWPVISIHVTNLFNGCLAHAFHPPLWKHALVQVIPKPGKANYFAPKSYCCNELTVS